MIKANGIEGKYLEYNGKPLVREGNEIYYGDMSDKFYLFMLVFHRKTPLLQGKMANIAYPDNTKTVLSGYLIIKLWAIMPEFSKPQEPSYVRFRWEPQPQSHRLRAC